jgi:thymidylate synthase ThyX
VVKGALFARYSRSAKSLRRLFLDEFVNDLDIEGDESIDATMGLARAEELYEKVFFEYGDDSVAQLGGVHLACEQASNLLTKILEWGRLMSYLEQSTRYISYDARLGGRYRFYRDPDVLASQFGTRYVGDMDRMFDAYSAAVNQVTNHVRDTVPRDPADSEFVYRQATRAKALDATRGMLPAASLSNVGIYGSGQAFEALLLRMRAHPLPEARQYADLMLHELRKVIPSFLRRVDIADRGGAWVDYLSSTRTNTAELVERLLGGAPADLAPEVQLVDFDPDAENKLVAAICYSHSHLPESTLIERARSMTADEKLALVRAYVRAGRSSASTTASTCCPTTGRSATCNATACSRSSGRRSHRTTAPPSPSSSTRPAPVGCSTRRSTGRRVCSTICIACSRSRRRTRCRWPTGSGT